MGEVKKGEKVDVLMNRLKAEGGGLKVKEMILWCGGILHLLRELIARVTPIIANRRKDREADMYNNPHSFPPYSST